MPCMPIMDTHNMKLLFSLWLDLDPVSLRREEELNLYLFLFFGANGSFLPVPRSCPTRYGLWVLCRGYGRLGWPQNLRYSLRYALRPQLYDQA
jgi:hypothetical protein